MCPRRKCVVSKEINCGVSKENMWCPRRKTHVPRTNIVSPEINCGVSKEKI